MFLAGFDLTGGLIGGVAIGAASSMLLWLTGRVTGISGISHSLVTARSEHDMLGWRLSYVAGLVASGAVLALARPSSFGSPSLLRPITAIAAGLIVGFGTRLGNGCTSGHGVCGLPRLSPRSLAAVVTFMATGAATATLARGPLYNLLYQDTPMSLVIERPLSDASTGVFEAFLRTAPIWAPTAAVIGTAFLLFQRNGWLRKLLGRTAPPAPGSRPAPTAAPTHASVVEHGVSFADGALFGAALGISGMTNPDRVLGFLDFAGSRGWDVTLAFVMGGAVMVNLATFAWLRRGSRKPLLAGTGTVGSAPLDSILTMGMAKANLLVDWKLLAGSALFGIGWGLSGVCPGPAIVSLGANTSLAALLVPSMLVGMCIFEATMGGGFFHHHNHHHHAHPHGTQAAHAAPAAAAITQSADAGAGSGAGAVPAAPTTALLAGVRSMSPDGKDKPLIAAAMAESDKEDK